MKGTEKQIKWAEDIKVKVITALTDCRNFFMTCKEYDSTNPEHIKVAENFTKNIDTLEKEEYAGDIIDMFSGVTATNPMQAYQQFIAALRLSGNPHKKNYIF